jgi:XXXCH domain-containing protein
MKKAEAKIKRILNPRAAAKLLQQLACELQGEAVAQESEFGPLLAGYSKLNLTIKPKEDGLQLNLKIERNIPVDQRAEPGTEQTVSVSEERGEAKKTKAIYKSLKKRMKTEFKLIAENLEQNRLPEASVLEEFLSNCERMVTFRDFGEEYYADFTAACDRFREAYQRKDFRAFQMHFSELDQLKEQCHKRYK